ncbi:MAG: HlyU family transcriptional regulator [Gammaproteobacteria bacterium]|nr:HlyU family transcriptional regulator [Gammaproteobacteria bacterium]
MGLKSLFRKHTAAGHDDKLGEPVEYNGYTIRPAPRKQGSHFHTAGVITKEYPDGAKEQHFIRADTHSSWDDACAHAVMKARQIIDQQGERLFDQTSR